MIDIKHKIGIKGTKEKVFNALGAPGGIANWWTKQVKGDSHVGGRIHFSFSERFAPNYDILAEIVKLTRPEKVVWKVLEGPLEWVGTEIAFKLETIPGGTIVHFTHSNWRESTDFMAQCTTKWGIFLMSLKEFIETGKGHPFPDDVRLGYNDA